jgi:hypothetical protein
MPTLYEYFGLTVLFYSNEHEPVHVHGKYQGYEGKAEILVEEGKIVSVRIVSVRGRRPLPPKQLEDFRLLVESRAEEIVDKWIAYFVLHKHFTSERISQRIR